MFFLIINLLIAMAFAYTGTIDAVEIDAAIQTMYSEAQDFIETQLDGTYKKNPSFSTDERIKEIILLENSENKTEADAVNIANSYNLLDAIIGANLLINIPDILTKLKGYLIKRGYLEHEVNKYVDYLQMAFNLYLKGHPSLLALNKQKQKLEEAVNANIHERVHEYTLIQLQIFEDLAKVQEGSDFSLQRMSVRGIFSPIMELVHTSLYFPDRTAWERHIKNRAVANRNALMEMKAYNILAAILLEEIIKKPNYIETLVEWIKAEASKAQNINDRVRPLVLTGVFIKIIEDNIDKIKKSFRKNKISPYTSNAVISDLQRYCTDFRKDIAVIYHIADLLQKTPIAKIFRFPNPSPPASSNDPLDVLETWKKITVGQFSIMYLRPSINYFLMHVRTKTKTSKAVTSTQAQPKAKPQAQPKSKFPKCIILQQRVRDFFRRFF